MSHQVTVSESDPYVPGDLSNAAAMLDSALGTMAKVLAVLNTSLLELAQVSRKSAMSGRCS